MHPKLEHRHCLNPIWTTIERASAIPENLQGVSKGPRGPLLKSCSRTDGYHTPGRSQVGEEHEPNTDWRKLPVVICPPDPAFMVFTTPNQDR